MRNALSIPSFVTVQRRCLNNSDICIHHVINLTKERAAWLGRFAMGMNVFRSEAIIVHYSVCVRSCKYLVRVHTRIHIAYR